MSDARVSLHDDGQYAFRFRGLGRALIALLASVWLIALAIPRRLLRWHARRAPADASPVADGARRQCDARRRPSNMDGSRSASSSPAPVTSAASSRLRASREPRFSTVRVLPEFSPGGYPATFAELQASPGGKLLDLVPARLLCADIFENLASAWNSRPEAIPRLGILLSFERWVMLRDVALVALDPLAARGVRVEVFYAEQASAGYLVAWFAHGQVVHDVPAVIRRLAAHWHPSEGWPIVLDTLCRLARAHSSAFELPGLLTQLAALALSCGGEDRAATLAREALCCLPETPSATRCQALRELGTALICQGQTAAGLRFLEQAFTMAAQAKAPDIGASALCHTGLYALNHGDYPGAERRFRDAITLLSTSCRRRHLLGLAHHCLAVALLHLGHPDAEQHAQAALALRADPNSHLAEEDRILLAKLRELRGDAKADQRRDVVTPDDALVSGAPSTPLASGRPTCRVRSVRRVSTLPIMLQARRTERAPTTYVQTATRILLLLCL